MSSNGDVVAEAEDRLHEIVLAYLEAAQAGWAPAPERVLAAYPAFRADLEEFLLARTQAERLVAPLRDAVREADGAQAAPSIGQLGDFRLLREVGRGGMGVVYEAEQISLRRRVALKVLPFAAAVDPRQLQRFRNEAQAAAHLRHDHIVPVYAVGSERGVHYYAMQFVDGQSLAALIAELRQEAEKPPAAPGCAPTPGLDPATSRGGRPVVGLTRDRTPGGRRHAVWVARLGRQAALALDHAHQMGIVHRDVKPANLLLDPQGQLWVADFGLARMSSDTGVTRTGEMLGTLRYASPEQALARPGLVDQRSDVYALGATLYELLTLRPLFEGRDQHDLLRRIAEQEPTAPRSLDRSIPIEVETILLKAVAKEPADRYATARELADDLQRFVDDQPIQARRPSCVEKISKWARRHRSVVVWTAAGLLLLVGGLALATLLTARAYGRERERAREAEAERVRAEESFRAARQAVDQFAQISEEELVGHPFLQPLRRRLLVAALVYYEDFLEQRRDDPSIRRELALSRERVRSIVAELTLLMGAERYIHLHNPEVRKELHLSDEQGAALTRIEDRWRTVFREASRKGPAEMERRRVALAREQDAEVARLLTPAQMGRLNQIAIRLRGPFAFSDPDVADVLHLTAEQRQQMRAGQEEWWSGGPRFGPPGPPGPLGPGGGDAAGRRIVDKLMEKLTPEQRRTWNDLVGEPLPPALEQGAPPFPLFLDDAPM